MLLNNVKHCIAIAMVLLLTEEVLTNHCAIKDQRQGLAFYCSGFYYL